jgi:hypothetical protein
VRFSASWLASWSRGWTCCTRVWWPAVGVDLLALYLVHDQRKTTLDGYGGEIVGWFTG